MSDISGNEAIVKSLKKSVAFWELEAERDRTLALQNNIPKSQAEATAEKANDYRGRYLSAQQKSKALEYQVDSLKRQLEQLQVQLTYGTINSPYEGVVSRRLIDPGDLAAPGKPLVIVEDRSSMMLAFNVPQEDLVEIKEGLEVLFNIRGESHKATLTHLDPSLDANRTLRAECVLLEKEIKGLTSGSYVPISIVVSELNDAVLVPTASLIESPDGKLYVFAVSGEKLEPKKITVTGRGADRVAVTGLESGEVIVSSTFLGWVTLASGMKVESVQ
jgi:RND family efflux transporter MFP subunit